MAKTNDYEAKKARLAELFSMQAEIEEEIRTLLEPQRIAVLPRGFSVSTEVSRIVREAGTDGITPQEVLAKLDGQYPDAIDREKVASALAYLKNTKKSIEQTGRGMYRIVSNENPAE